MIIFHTPEGSLKLLNEAPLLDLVNSTDRQRGREIDFLTPINIAGWAKLAGFANEDLAAALGHSHNCSTAASDARLLRERVLSHLSRPGEDDKPLADLLNAWLPAPLLQGAPDLILARAHAPAGQFRANLAFSALTLLVGPERELIQHCPAEGCSWFFLDRSGGRRQWCTMEGCGNLEKARRLRRRRSP